MLVLAALGAGPTARAMPESPLQFDVAEGRNLNSFVRQGPVAAHLVLRSGRDLRILTAFRGKQRRRSVVRPLGGGAVQIGQQDRRRPRRR